MRTVRVLKAAFLCHLERITDYEYLYFYIFFSLKKLFIEIIWDL